MDDIKDVLIERYIMELLTIIILLLAWHYLYIHFGITKIIWITCGILVFVVEIASYTLTEEGIYDTIIKLVDNNNNIITGIYGYLLAICIVAIAGPIVYIVSIFNKSILQDIVIQNYLDKEKIKEIKENKLND